MKPTALLAVAIFLVCAPSPDSQTISEMSHGFLSSVEIEPLLAADSNSNIPPLVNIKAAEQLSENQIIDNTQPASGEI